MNKNIEQELINAFRLITEKERAMVLALIQRCASTANRDLVNAHVIVGYSRPR